MTFLWNFSLARCLDIVGEDSHLLLTPYQIVRHNTLGDERRVDEPGDRGRHE